MPHVSPPLRDVGACHAAHCHPSRRARLSFLASTTRATLHQMSSIGDSIQAKASPRLKKSSPNVSPLTAPSKNKPPIGTIQTPSNGATTESTHLPVRGIHGCTTAATIRTIPQDAAHLKLRRAIPTTHPVTTASQRTLRGRIRFLDSKATSFPASYPVSAQANSWCAGTFARESESG
jgi:hypothetical protein